MPSTRPATCQRKVRFGCRLAADLVIKRQRMDARSYRCNQCGLWHITSGLKRHRDKKRGDQFASR